MDSVFIINSMAASDLFCLHGFCTKGEDITVKLRGGDLVVNYTDESITLTGDTKLVYEGVAEY